jgi:hypothetical protein
VNFGESTNYFDSAFREIQGLTWLPWIGQRFRERLRPKRLLIVGESHYVRAKSADQLQNVLQEHLNYPNLTRDVVSECLVSAEWRNRTLDTLPKLLFRTASIDRERLWSDTAFYNFIQRPMHYNQDGQPERPTLSDFVSAWKVFSDLVRVIQPSYCLFIGVEAANSFNHAMTTLGHSFIEVARTQQVGRTYARTAKLDAGDMSTELFFVQHLGKFFSWSRWHEHLKFQHADFMSWLEVESYPLNGGQY